MTLDPLGILRRLARRAANTATAAPIAPAPTPAEHVRALLKQAVEARGMHVRFVDSFGFKFDTAFWIAVATDAQRDAINRDPAFLARLNAIFDDSGYNAWLQGERAKGTPADSKFDTQRPGIAVESQESVDRQYQGNWYYAMK